jgi:hypothetical protein
VATAARGSALPHAPFADADIRAIRANRYGRTARELAAVYGVHYRTIEKIRSRETWAHVK